MHPYNHPNPAPIRPQNLSCPAGGTNTNKRGQRGVDVAPPSPNTLPSTPLVLHRGFDTLALSVKATLPHHVHQHFLVAKAEAAEARTDVPTDWNGMQFHIKGHGGKGYAILASGGPFGATWFFKTPNAKDPWGVRVSFGSDFLATLGLGAAKSHLETVMEALEMPFTAPDVSIGRADYCVDLLAPNFTLNPDNFTMPARMKRRDHMGGADMSVHGTSGKVTSITVGSPANRQAIIYDKRAEVVAKSKRQWWTIWQKTLDQMCAAGQIDHPITLDPTNPAQSRVIRVEFRAGKTALKDRWKITTWSDFFDRFGDLCRQFGEDIRYCAPSPSDTNRSRWPNHVIWEIACAELNDDLFEMRSDVPPCAIKEVHRETHISVLLRNIVGTAITHAALNGVTYPSIADHMRSLGSEMCDYVTQNPTKTRKQLAAAKARYAFITPQR